MATSPISPSSSLLPSSTTPCCSSTKPTRLEFWELAAEVWPNTLTFTPSDWCVSARSANPSAASAALSSGHRASLNGCGTKHGHRCSPRRSLQPLRLPPVPRSTLSNANPNDVNGSPLSRTRCERGSSTPDCSSRKPVYPLPFFRLFSKRKTGRFRPLPASRRPASSSPRSARRPSQPDRPGCVSRCTAKSPMNSSTGSPSCSSNWAPDEFDNDPRPGPAPVGDQLGHGLQLHTDRDLRSPRLSPVPPASHHGSSVTSSPAGKPAQHGLDSVL